MKVDKEKINYYLVYRFKFLAWGLFFLIILVGYFLLINPKIKKIFSPALDLQTIKEELSLEKEKFNRLKRIKENFEKIDQVSLEKLRKIIPEKDEALNFIIFLENLIQENDFSTPGINFSFGKSPDNLLGSIEVNLNLSGGTYQSFKDFLKRLEKNLRIVDVKSISLSPVKGFYSVNLNTYFFSPLKKESISETPNLKKISDFINSKQFLELEEKKELIISPETIQTGRVNPFLPF